LNTLSPLHPSPAATTSGPDGSFGVRPATPADREACGRIFWEAFAGLASRHDFPIEPSDPGFTERMFAMWLGHPGFDCTVLEREGEVVGSAVVDNRCPIRGIGPVTVAPSVQDAGGGRLLMEAIMGRSIQQGAPGMRLVQTAYHYRSLALYSNSGSRCASRSLSWPERRHGSPCRATRYGRPSWRISRRATRCADRSTALIGAARWRTR
jgi:hypothetical protein